MMVMLAAGVQKSLQFTHLMNSLNLATLAFAIGAGSFYADFMNWTDSPGFMPKGWSGVSRDSK